MSASVKLSANIERYLMNAERSLRDNVDNAIVKAGFVVRSEAQKNIQTGTRSGKIYKRQKSGITSQRSAPGEYPKSDTGTLAKNIFNNRQSFGVTIVGTNIEYGEFLENKSPNNGGRPWLERTFDENEKKIENIIYRAARKGLDPNANK